jgi:hypothetical protein
LQQAAQLDPDYREPEAPTAIEEAAVMASKMSSEELEAFSNSLREANEREAAKWQPGYDPDTGTVVDETPPFDPSSLDSEGFAIFMRAAASGGALPRETPAGFTREDWAKKVDSALGVKS